MRRGRGSKEQFISRKVEILAMRSSCWVCGNIDTLSVIKPSSIKGVLRSNSFAITDSAYGQTTTLARCKKCGFIESVDSINVLGYYQDLEDRSYEFTRKERGLQARKILETIQKYSPNKKILDIGAGSGILVEEALKMGFIVEGVEPSRWLQAKAAERKLPVVLGTFPNQQLNGPYDIITLIDVIEHVDKPLKLLSDIKCMLVPEGLLVIVTPDVGSFIARILGFQWWHFRIAHIGYFNKTTLNLAASKTGFRQVNMQKAKWYFSADYLWERVMVYIPVPLRLKAPEFFKKITIPLNLGDSMFAIYRA